MKSVKDPGQMKGTVSKIDYERKGTDEQWYQSVYFRLFGGDSAKTHLCKGFDNYKNWKGCVEVGAVLDNLIMKSDNIIDADSKPKRVDHQQMKLL